MNTDQIAAESVTQVFDFLENDEHHHVYISGTYSRGKLEAIIKSAIEKATAKLEALLDRQDEGHAEYVEKMTKELTAQIKDRKRLEAELAAKGHWEGNQWCPSGEAIDAAIIAAEAWEMIGSKIDNLAQQLTREEAVECFLIIKSAFEKAYALGMNHVLAEREKDEK